MAGSKVVVVKEKKSGPCIRPIYSFPREETNDYYALLNWLIAKSIRDEDRDENTCYFIEKRKMITFYERGCINIPDDVTPIEYKTMIDCLGMTERYKMNGFSGLPMPMQEIIRLTSLNSGGKNGKEL